MKNRKVCLVGCGSVGMAFIYGAINQGLFDEYILIDYNQDIAKGNAIDCLDSIAFLDRQPKIIKNGNYNDCSDADIVVITAGIAQQPHESRIDLVNKNAKIIKEIALKIKDSGFMGITIIASNPVDIITNIYQKVTNYNPHKIIGTGTSLDSGRLVKIIANQLNVSPKNSSAYVVGEHGDTSISLFSLATIGGVLLTDYSDLFNDEKKADIHNQIVQTAYEIIKLKKATYYGIGAAINKICKAILYDQDLILSISCISKYSQNIYLGWPVFINKNGWHDPIDLKLSQYELEKFNYSCNQMNNILKLVCNELGI